MMTHEEIQAVYEQGPDAVIALVKALSLLIAQQQEQIAQLQGRVVALEDRLATNSRNSSKPPRVMVLLNRRARCASPRSESPVGSRVIRARRCNRWPNPITWYSTPQRSAWPVARRSMMS